MTPYNYLAIGGRAVLGGVFVVAGLAHLPSFRMLCAAMAARGVPFPAVVLIAGSLFQIAMGGLLAADVARCWAALGLIGFTAASSVMMLNFWHFSGMARENMLGAFMNNVALCGALLAIGFAPA